MKKLLQNKKSKFVTYFSILALLVGLNFVFPFAYVFAGDANGLDSVTHAHGYSGTGGTITIDVGIDPTSVNANDMIISTQNVIDVYNNLTTSSPNIIFAGAPSAGQFDFESVLLHEMGHSLGLAHCNLATESGLSGSSRDYTKTTDGEDDILTFTPGFDGVIGSGDDFRGDDVNLNYFKIIDNNPFTGSAIVDETTYSRDIADLPPSDAFSANGSRDVANALGLGNTSESVMQQGTFNNEAQRTLAEDDAAGLKFASSGLDRIQGTADDYTIVLNYVGLTDEADIIVDFDNQTGFAVSVSNGFFISGEDIQIASPNNIYFNTDPNWYFNTTLNNDDFLSETLGISVYPNPSSNLVTISNPRLVDLESVIVYDINGRVLLTKNIPSTMDKYKTEIDISSFNAGIYIFEINAKSGTEVQRIIKQ